MRNAELADTIGDVLHRPTVLPVPAFGPRLVLGGERADALLFEGQRVLPRVLQADGFAYAHPTLERRCGPSSTADPHPGTRIRRDRAETVRQCGSAGGDAGPAGELGRQVERLEAGVLGVARPTAPAAPAT